MERFICIHGHFYQPPRENAWLEAVEVQDSAYPYHDWNERITAECYSRNAASRILDGEGRIERIVNNYTKISFNFGPTLLAWMAANTPGVYGAIIESDRRSMKRFDGHGSAMAQAYNHMIMPLADRRDKETQVIWGIRDFEKRFGRKPDGMWLPETAVDLESLEVLVENGIRFSILAPHQAGRVRPLEGGQWQDVSNSAVDITMPYLQRLPSGGEIALFFYDGPISRAVAFEGILNSGESFADRLMDGFIQGKEGPQLAHIATDGESYGHHHPNGDMALAYVLHHIEETGMAELINYAAFLDRFPPTHEVEIVESSSWSCIHGIERWRGDCGCNSGGRPGWNQRWREPLRKALNWLRGGVATIYEAQGEKLLRDPWAARNDYIDVVFDRSQGVRERFFDRYAVKTPDGEEEVRLLKLLELQRQAMLMYTSCGWFFDELSGIETVQVIQYAGRAIQLAAQFPGGEKLEEGFLREVEKAESNIPDHGNGRQIFEKFVRPAMVDLRNVGAHYAVSSMFEDYPEQDEVFCYGVQRDHYRFGEAGMAKLAVGEVTIISKVTLASSRFDFGVVHLGDHNITCGIREDGDREGFLVFGEEIFKAFNIADFPEAIRVLDRRYPAYRSSLTSLFQDEQRKILALILANTMENIEASYRQIYNAHAPLMRFMRVAGSPVPRALYTAGEVVLNRDLRETFRRPDINTEEIAHLLSQVRLSGITLDKQTLEFTLRRTLEGTMVEIMETPEDLDALNRLGQGMQVISMLPFDVELRMIQDQCYELAQELYSVMKYKANRGNTTAGEWLERFRTICWQLNLRIE